MANNTERRLKKRKEEEYFFEAVVAEYKKQRKLSKGEERISDRNSISSINKKNATNINKQYKK